MTRHLPSILVQAALFVGAAFSLTCVEPLSVECPNGLVCPSGFECAAAQNVCIADGCGNGELEAGEECDDGNILEGDTCSPECTVEECGNDIVDVGEVCDDGNNTSDDGCRADCLSDESCGNGELDEEAGEICDDGNRSSGDGCRADCISDETCGNGEIDSAVGEACDDGNTLDGDQCSSDCTAGAGCGNGFVDDGEICDDGDQTDGDGCSANCLSLEVCGNLITDFAVGEVCDDGDTDNGDGCRADCRSDETCGNGELDPNAATPEQCDDDNNMDGDGCSSTCVREECGNGVHDEEFGEACDDGNESDGPCIDTPGAATCSVSCDNGSGLPDQSLCDASASGFFCDEVTLLCNGLDFCSHDCLVASQGCGNGVRDPNEECDDGNPTGTITDYEDNCITGLSGEPIRCQLNECGDGYQDNQGPLTEQCDEGGNTQDCDLNCTPASCGDGTLNPNHDPDGAGPIGFEQCDDFDAFGTGAGDGCFNCRLEVCGNGVTDAGEVCDDGDTDSGDGCRGDCSKTEVCGDSFVDSAAPLSETCDDGEATPDAGDGCGTDCRTETGWTCVGTGAASCTPICGDGLLNGNETCDQGGGNVANGDGCSASCQQETGWTCTGTGTTSCDEICGDGLKVGAETCDQDGGNVATGDGCNASCVQESGFTCTGTGPASCTANCGDGVIKAGFETCDQGSGDVDAGDGCSAACQLETGWTCTAPSGNPPTSTCTPICGDGLIEGAETCDQGTADPDSPSNGDGCSSSCQVESTNWTCNGAEPTVCSPICGDGAVLGGETCDQGTNDPAPLANGDGCSETCQEETGFDCTGTTNQTCVGICGDGLVRGAETCDQGTNDPDSPSNGDGCSNACATETGWACTGSLNQTCSEVCGDTLEVGDEDCDQGSGNVVAGDGCDAECHEETGWTCTGAPDVCTPDCGDGLVRGTETCDDRCTDGADGVGNCGSGDNGDGCSRFCAVETGYTCINEQGVPPASVCSLATDACGDGTISGGEQCDQGQGTDPDPQDSGDGCSALCTIESGWSCVGSPSVCSRVCGDGIRTSNEGCDDGDNENGDGCSSTCTVETSTGWTCTTDSPAVCTAINCGDGLKAGSEACDDTGPTAENGDGCSASCTIEAGWTCTGSAPSTCTAAACGDGVRAGSEACDDGDTVSGDGCSASCAVETSTGWSCTGAIGSQSVCSATACGDGFKAGTEACDNDVGSPPSGSDGCSATCTVESGWTCTGGGASSCTAAFCGDGITAGAEVCDDGNFVTEPSTCDYGQTSCSNGCNAGCTATVTRTAQYCGDGTEQAAFETCDQGTNDPGTQDSGDGCSALCQQEAGYTCTSGTNQTCGTTCGDGVKAGAEVCDDGNNTAGDGCDDTSGQCDAEDSGFDCTGTSPSVCTAVCGDGIVAGAETCDQGSNDAGDPSSGDGCSSTCSLETGFVCTGATNQTCATDCGDGIRAGAEACDDADENNDDGCSSACLIEAGWSCTGGSGTSTCSAICGDGVDVDGAGSSTIEACDDGNVQTESATCDYGLTTCANACNATCTATITRTAQYCGDGTVQGTFETCDDGNALACGTCDSGCQTVIAPTAATGFIFAVEGVSLVDGETFTVSDGDVVYEFEFDDDATSTGDVAITIVGTESASAIATLIAGAIDGTDLQITAVASGAGVSLTHVNATSLGNATITDTVTNTGFFVIGMSGGAGNDCDGPTGCVAVSPHTANDVCIGDCVAGVCD